jgi:prolyl-tRNA editing enzyme YbaK/EbsC (Cys-tRNA(Pro) deacylase)
VHSLEQAAAERGQRPEQVIRSILFRLGEGEYVMVLVAGPGQLSWAALRKYLGVSRMSMASEEEVLAVTGAPRGAVSPFGLSAPLRILADASIFLEDEISIGSGVRGTTVILTQADLQRALGPVERGEFCCA